MRDISLFCAIIDGEDVIMGKTVFIGHRQVFRRGVYEELLREIARQIECGCKEFTMGNHGEFDRLALSACRFLRKRHPEIQIEVVITSLSAIKKDAGIEAPYHDVKTVMFDIEEVYYKRKITVSNRKMIDGGEALICYVDEKNVCSGAKKALNYAKRKGLEIINLYREEVPTSPSERTENKTSP